jgi:hypothetical protein
MPGINQSARYCREPLVSYYQLDEVVVASVEIVVRVIVSVGSVAVVDVEKLSGRASDADVDSSSTTGVEVELTNGGALVMYLALACTAYSPTSRSPLTVSYRDPPVVHPHETFVGRDWRVRFIEISIDLGIAWICSDCRAISEIIDVLRPDDMDFGQSLRGASVGVTESDAVVASASVDGAAAVSGAVHAASSTGAVSVEDVATASDEVASTCA